MLPLWLHLLALTLPTPVSAQEVVAVVPVSAVLQPLQDKPEAPPVAVMVDSVVVRITPGDESLVELDIALRALEPGWVDLAVTGGALAVSSARLDGRAVALSSRDGGARWLTSELRGAHRLVVRGSVATPAASLDLPLPLASRARVELTEPGWDLELQGGIPVDDGTVLLASSQRLAASWRPHAAPAPKPRVITVQSATAVSFDESGLEGHATLRYLVAHGSVDQVSFDIAGQPDSVEVTGPAVRGHSVQGQRVTVRLARPMEGGFELQVAFRTPPPGDDQAHAAPLVKPGGVFEHTGWFTVARADTAMLVPEPRAGLEAVPSSSLPAWATGLVPGTPVASYAISGRSQALDYRLLSYDPVAAPPTVVDEARYQLAATAHGRVLMKARYTVRNDRNQYLRLEPPAGFEVLGVRVAGQVRQPVADGSSIYIPLEKSVESLQGLISFPVEVYLLGAEAAWEKKGRRSLQTPAVDAPVAYARWEVWLPADVEWDELSGLPRHVQDWTSSEHALEYGRAVESPDVTDTSGWDEDEEDDRRPTKATQASSSRRSDRGRDKDGAHESSEASISSAKQDANEDASLEYFNQAYQAYNANDFDTAQQYLERSLQLDSGNASAHALLGNVQVVMGETGGEGQGDETQARRVRDLARARAVDTELEQKEVQKKAEQALRAGDLEVAERELERLEEMTRDLSRLEQNESIEQRLLLEETAKQLNDTRGELAKKRKSKAPVSVSASSGSTTVAGASFGSSLEGRAAPAKGEPAPVAMGPQPAAADQAAQGWGVELDEIPDRFVQLILDEPSEPMPSADEAWPDTGGGGGSGYILDGANLDAPVGGDWQAAYGDTDGLSDDFRVADAAPEEEAWEDETEDMEEEVYWADIDDYAYAETLSVDRASRPQPARRAASAVGDALRGAGRAMRRPKAEEPVYADAYDSPATPATAGPVAVPRPQDDFTLEHSGVRNGYRTPSGDDDGGVVYHRQVEYDFDSIDIEGELVRPEGQLLLDRQQAQFAPLVELRSNFDGELGASTTELAGSLAGLDDAGGGWAGAGPSEPIVMDFGVQAAASPDPASMELEPTIITLEGALSDIAGSFELTMALAERARNRGEIEQLQALNERASTIKALLQVSGQAAAELLLAEQTGDYARADHEKQKLLIADRKVREIEAEARGLASGEIDPGGHTVAMVLESDTGPLQGLAAGIGGLLGAKGSQEGSGGLGSRGSGLGGGGTAEGLGGLGTHGRGCGASGYGAGGGSYGSDQDAPPPVEAAPTPEPSPKAAPPPPPAPPSSGRKDAFSANARGNVARGPVTTSRQQVTVTTAPGGTTALPEASQTVSAAHLVLNIPKAGERLAFEQLLVAENEPLTIDIRYRLRSRR